MNTAKIIRPQFNSTPKEIKIMPFVNTPNVIVREQKANEYMAKRRQRIRKEYFLSFVSGLCLFASMIITYFVFCLF